MNIMWHLTEPDKGAGRILYIADETVSRLVWPNSCWCIRLRIVYQRIIHQLT